MSPAAPFFARCAVVIPALNEAPCVAATVRAWRARGVAVVRVADNGSTDGTSAIAAAAGAEVVREPRRGYGAAAWTGMRDLPEGIEWIIFSSADGSDQLDDTEAAAFQRAIDGGAALVLGERVTLAASRAGLTPTQRFGNALACGLIALGWGRRFRDLAALRAIRRRTLDDLRLADRAFGWNVEMQVRAVERGVRIAEVPVRFHPRLAGKSKISGNLSGIVRAGWGILAMVGGLYFERASRRREDAVPRGIPAGPRSS